MRRGLTNFEWDEDPEDMVRTEAVFGAHLDEYSDGDNERYREYEDALRKKPSK